MPPAPHYANAVRLRKVHCPILFGPALRKNCLRLFFTVRPQSGFTELTKRAHSPARRPAPTHLPLFDGRLIAQSYRIVHCPYPINLRDRAQSARCKTRFIRRSRCGAHSSDRGPILACYSSSIALFFFFRFLRCISPLLLLIGILSLSLAALAPKTNRRRSPPNPSDPPPPFPSSFKRSKTREALPPLQPSFQPPSTPSVRPFRDSSAVPPPAPVSPPPAVTAYAQFGSGFSSLLTRGTFPALWLLNHSHVSALSRNLSPPVPSHLRLPQTLPLLLRCFRSAKWS